MSKTKNTIDIHATIPISTSMYIIICVLCLFQAWVFSDIIRQQSLPKLLVHVVSSIISLFIYEKYKIYEVLIEKKDQNDIVRYWWRIEKNFRILERIFILVSGLGNIIYLIGIFYRKKKFREHLNH